MHSGSVLGADADNNVAEYGSSACTLADLDGNDLLVLQTELLGRFGIEVNVSLSGDNALSDFYLTLGASENAAGCTGYVA